MTSLVASALTAPVDQRADHKRVVAEQWGRLAEWIAVIMLMLRGYRILARRWRCSAGEIDIVAVRGQRLACVEVKFRRRGAGATVSPRQCQRLYAAADAFVARFDRYAPCTRAFDAVMITRGGCPAYARDHLQPLVSSSRSYRAASGRNRS